MTVNKLTSPISQNDLINKTNEIIDNLGGGGATDVQINGTSITSGGVANILTQTAYNASSNKIATMSDLPDSEIFVAEYDVTSYADVLAAYNVGKTIVCLRSTTNVDYYYKLYYKASSGFTFTSCAANDIYRISLSATSGWLSLQTTTLQPTSTAVTHTNSTQVGNGTKPIYISSTGAATASSSTVGGSSTPVYLNAGTITSTGLSIASSRFDGQWVAKTKDLSSVTTQGTYTLDLNTYLPDTNNQYEVIVVYTVTSKKTSVAYTTLYSDLIPITENILNIKTSSTSHSLYNGCLLNIPVRRYLYFKISNNSVDGAYIGAVAYRRIGTNT